MTLFQKEKHNQLFLLSAYVLLACLWVLLAKPYYIVSICIVLLPPSVMNFLWLKKSRGKILIFSIVATLLFAPPIELVSRLADVWDVQSIFPRPFGVVPFENMLFAFLNFFWGLSFYEHFVDYDRSKKLSYKFRYLVFLFISLSVIVYGVYFYDMTLVKANYFTMSVPVLIIPSFLIFKKNTHLLKKTILPTIFFAGVFFIYELVSLKIGSWWWPGQYLYAVNVFGKPFPLDDIVIWYFLSTPALIGGYEFFADDYQ